MNNARAAFGKKSDIVVAHPNSVSAACLFPEHAPCGKECRRCHGIFFNAPEMLALRFGKVYLHSRIIFMRKVGEIFAHPRSVRIFGVERKIDLYPAVALAVPLAIKLKRFRDTGIGCGIGVFVKRNDRAGYIQLYTGIKRCARGIGARKIHIRKGDGAARDHLGDRFG